MPDWLRDVEGLTQKGQIAVPYTWWVGETGSRFLLSIRDDRKLLGNKCTSCNTVFVPPRKNCGRCFVDIDEWVEVGDEGVVISHTIVRYPFEVHPVDAPFAYALIKLDGADVGFLHLIKDNLDALKNGVRVRARFREKRTGHILDIDSFEIL